MVVEQINNTMIAKLRDIIESGDSFALFGHRNIDGDALGSMLGLGGVLEKLDKNVRYFTSNEPSVVFDFVQWREKVDTEFDYGEYDALIFLDFSPYDRIEEFTKEHEAWFDEQTLIVIDHHHGDAPEHASVVLKDVTSMSNAERVYKIITMLWEDKIDSTIATNLYLWLATDSGNFVYDNKQQSPWVMRTAYELIMKWADKQLIVEKMFRSKSLASVEYMQLVLQRMKHYQWNILTSYMLEEELKEKWLDRYQWWYAQPLMQQIKWIDLIILFKHNYEKASMSCSLRGRNKYDCSKIAQSYGGGWHFNAAGCRIPVGDRNFEEAMLRTIDEIYENYVKKASN